MHRHVRTWALSQQKYSVSRSLKNSGGEDCRKVFANCADKTEINGSSRTRRMHEKIREGGIRETSFDLKVQTSSNPRVWNPSYVETLESGQGVAFRSPTDRMFQPAPWGSRKSWSVCGWEKHSIRWDKKSGFISQLYYINSQVWWRYFLI